MDIKHQAIEGVKWSGVQQWGGRVISLLVLVIIARFLEPEAFGLVAMALLYIAFVQVFIEQGFGAAIVQRANLEEEHLDTAFWISITSGAFLTLVSISIAGFVADLFQQTQLESIVRWESLSLLIGGTASVQQAILRRQLDFKKLAVSSLVASTIGGIVGVALAIMQYGIWSLVAQHLVSTLAGCIALWRVSSWRPRFRFSSKRFFELFSFGLNIMGISLLNFVNRHGDDLLIGYFLGPTLLGFYTIAYQLLVKMTELLASVGNAVAFPTYSRLQTDRELISTAFYKSILFMSLVSFPAFVGVGIIAPELVLVIYGAQWEASIPVLQVLVLIGILHSILFYHDSLILALGKPSWRLGMTVINAVSNIIAFSIAVRWGIVAVAAAYVIRGYLTTPIEFWMLRKIGMIDIKNYFKQLTVPIIGSIAIIVVVTGLRFLLSDLVSLSFQLVIYIVFGIVAYLIIVKLVMPSLLDQIITILRYILPKRFLRPALKHER